MSHWNHDGKPAHAASSLFGVLAIAQLFALGGAPLFAQDRVEAGEIVPKLLKTTSPVRIRSDAVEALPVRIAPPTGPGQADAATARTEPQVNPYFTIEPEGDAKILAKHAKVTLPAAVAPNARNLGVGNSGMAAGDGQFRPAAVFQHAVSEGPVRSNPLFQSEAHAAVDVGASEPDDLAPAVASEPAVVPDIGVELEKMQHAAPAACGSRSIACASSQRGEQAISALDDAIEVLETVFVESPKPASREEHRAVEVDPRIESEFGMLAIDHIGAHLEAPVREQVAPSDDASPQVVEMEMVLLDEPTPLMKGNEGDLASSGSRTTNSTGLLRTHLGAAESAGLIEDQPLRHGAAPVDADAGTISMALELFRSQIAESNVTDGERLLK